METNITKKHILTGVVGAGTLLLLWPWRKYGIPNPATLKEYNKTQSAFEGSTPSESEISAWMQEKGMALSAGKLETGHREATRALLGRPYAMGGKGLSGGIDCSGFVYLVRRIAALGKLGWQKKWDAHGSYEPMVNELWRPVGSTTHSGNQWNGRNLMPGDVILLKQKNVPAFAQNRPFQISHIAIIIEDGGDLFVAESSASHYSGTGYMLASKWIQEAVDKQHTLWVYEPPEMQYVRAGIRPNGEFSTTKAVRQISTLGFSAICSTLTYRIVK